MKFKEEQLSRFFDESNHYRHRHKYIKNEACLSESDFCLANFYAFLKIIQKETEKGDNRPIYVEDFFERIDEAVDIAPIINELQNFDRPIYILISGGYSTERITNKMEMEKGENINVLHNVFFKF